MNNTPHWTNLRPQISAAIAQWPRLLFASDFDGTLAEIVDRPQDAVLDHEVRSLLGKLAELSGVTMAIVSGRALGDVRARVGLDGIFYCGNHGLEIVGPGIEWSSGEARAHRDQLARAIELLRARTASIEGIIIEDKELTATVHWRLVSTGGRERLSGIVAAVVQAHKGLRLAHGKAVWEIRPCTHWNKGSALQHLLFRSQVRMEQAIYLGDDDTDENAFRTLAGGLTLRVGACRPTAAQLRLDDPADVAAFLGELYEIRRARSADDLLPGQMPPSLQLQPL